MAEHEEHEEYVEHCDRCEDERVRAVAAATLEIMRRPVPKVTRGQGRMSMFDKEGE